MTLEHLLDRLPAPLARTVVAGLVVVAAVVLPVQAARDRHPRYRNDPATADELALVESLRTEAGL